MASLVARFRSDPVYRFVPLFLLYLLALSFAYSWATEHHFEKLEVTTRSAAAVSAALLSLASETTRLSGTVVTYQGFSVNVILECVGLFEMLIFAAAVTSFPTTWRKRAIGLGAGLPIIYAFNIVRIITLLLVGRYMPSAFEFFHIYFWQATLIILLTGLWLLWIIRVVRDEADPVPA
jgi:exosortase H (IPTLxxWG-CTERM-specific)